MQTETETFGPDRRKKIMENRIQVIDSLTVLVRSIREKGIKAPMDASADQGSARTLPTSPRLPNHPSRNQPHKQTHKTKQTYTNNYTVEQTKSKLQKLQNCNLQGPSLSPSLHPSSSSWYSRISVLFESCSRSPVINQQHTSTSLLHLHRLLSTPSYKNAKSN